MCVFVRVRRFFFGFFLVVLLSVRPLAAGGRHMVCKSYCFAAFFLRFVFFAFSLPFLRLLWARAAVNEFEFLFFTVFVFVFFGIQTSCFHAIFLAFAFFAFSLPFLCVLWARPAVNEFEFLFFYRFGVCLFFWYTNLLVFRQIFLHFAFFAFSLPFLRLLWARPA